MKLKAVVFDMDGTVLDTGEDLRNALVRAFGKAGLQFPYLKKEVTRFFGSGILVAVQRAILCGEGVPEGLLEHVGETREEVLQQGWTEGQWEKLEKAVSILDQPDWKEKIRIITDDFAQYYPDHGNIDTKPYDGILEVLDFLKEKGIPKAVVSNKIDAAVQQLVADYFPGRFEVSIGEQEGMHRKPAPDMVEAALKQLGVSKEEAVYVGDSEVDLLTAKNSGLWCLSVGWGFRSESFLHAHGASTILEDPAALSRELESLL